MRLDYHPIDRRKPTSIALQAFRENVTSQNGEDGIIARIFELIGTTNKVCIEFGAADGKELSNTWALINERGWSGVLIEGRKSSFRTLEARYGGNSKVRLFNRYVGSGINSLDGILAEGNCPTEPDLLCIDVDGVDWHIWQSLSRYQPRLLLIEFNPTIPNDVLFVPDDNPSRSHGCSLSALIELGKAKGYELAATTDWNAFFVHQTLFPALGIVDNSIDAMHQCDPYETKLFQLYDGTLLTAGNDRLMWAGGPLRVRNVPPWNERWRRFVRALKLLPGIRQARWLMHRLQRRA